MAKDIKNILVGAAATVVSAAFLSMIIMQGIGIAAIVSENTGKTKSAKQELDKRIDDYQKSYAMPMKVYEKKTNQELKDLRKRMDQLPPISWENQIPGYLPYDEYVDLHKSLLRVEEILQVIESHKGELMLVVDSLENAKNMKFSNCHLKRKGLGR